jgi:hypothetical protein
MGMDTSPHCPQLDPGPMLACPAVSFIFLEVQKGD